MVTLQKTRRLGAIAILAVGAVHLEQYLGSGYHSIPTIGPLFLLNAVSSGVVAIGLLMPIERVFHDRGAQLASGLLAAAAVAIAAGSLIALFISENGKLFGFSESGYRAAIVIRHRRRGCDDRATGAGSCPQHHAGSLGPRCDPFRGTLGLAVARRTARERTATPATSPLQSGPCARRVLSLLRTVVTC